MSQLTLTATTKNSHAATRVKLLKDGNVEVSHYNVDSTSTKKKITLDHMNLDAGGNNITNVGSVSSSLVSADTVSSETLSSNSIYCDGELSTLSLSMGGINMGVMYRHIVTVSISITGGKSCEFDIAIYNTFVII